MPGVASDGDLRCVRCGSSLRSGSAKSHSSGASTETHFVEPSRKPTTANLFATLEADDWELDDELRQVQRLINLSKAHSPSDIASAYTGHASELSLGLFANGSRTRPLSSSAVSEQPTRHLTDHSQSSQRSSLFSTIAWLVMSVGLMGFVCGAVLLGWSYFGGQEQLWHLGLPIALVGQVALLFGFILQLDRVRQDNSRAAAKLETVDERIIDLRHATTLLGTTRGSASQAFYAHMAEGASPHILLADLKGQLDLLATRMSKS